MSKPKEIAKNSPEEVPDDPDTVPVPRKEFEETLRKIDELDQATQEFAEAESDKDKPSHEEGVLAALKKKYNDFLLMESRNKKQQKRFLEVQKLIEEAEKKALSPAEKARIEDQKRFQEAQEVLAEFFKAEQMEGEQREERYNIQQELYVIMEEAKKELNQEELMELVIELHELFKDNIPQNEEELNAFKEAIERLKKEIKDKAVQDAGEPSGGDESTSDEGEPAGPTEPSSEGTDPFDGSGEPGEPAESGGGGAERPPEGVPPVVVEATKIKKSSKVVSGLKYASKAGFKKGFGLKAGAGFAAEMTGEFFKTTWRAGRKILYDIGEFTGANEFWRKMRDLWEYFQGKKTQW